MRIKTKNIYYLDEEDKKKIKTYLIENDLKHSDLCLKLGISYTYLSLMLNGVRPVSDKVKTFLIEEGIL